MSDKLRWLFNKVYKLLTNSSLSLQHWFKRETYPLGNKIFQICWLSATIIQSFNLCPFGGYLEMVRHFFYNGLFAANKGKALHNWFYSNMQRNKHFPFSISSLKFSAILVLQIAMSTVYSQLKKKKKIQISWTWCKSIATDTVCKKINQNHIFSKNYCEAISG